MPWDPGSLSPDLPGKSTALACEELLVQREETTEETKRSGRFEQPALKEILENRDYKWYGHLVRMFDDRLPNIIVGSKI